MQDGVIENWVWMVGNFRCWEEGEERQAYMLSASCLTHHGFPPAQHQPSALSSLHNISLDSSIVHYLDGHTFHLMAMKAMEMHLDTPNQTAILALSIGKNPRHMHKYGKTPTVWWNIIYDPVASCTMIMPNAIRVRCTQCKDLS